MSDMCPLRVYVDLASSIFVLHLDEADTQNLQDRFLVQPIARFLTCGTVQLE